MDQTTTALHVPKQYKKKETVRREKIPYYCYQSKASSSLAALLGPLTLSAHTLRGNPNMTRIQTPPPLSPHTHSHP